MSNPFRKQMPIRTDLRIRWRLLCAWVSDHAALSIAAFMVPALAVWLFMIAPSSTQLPDTTIDVVSLVTDIRSAQAAELARAENSIYHVTRKISEGGDKPEFVRAVLGSSEAVEPRVDMIETYQHNETALALIESNGTKRPFEAFLSRTHADGALSLHHYGPQRRLVDKDRTAYDEAHDLATLYSDYTSLQRPAIPVLSVEAEFVDINPATNQARFRLAASESLTIETFVDLETKQVVEEVIYVLVDDTVYEMTRVTYLAREVLPAERFEEIFDPNQFEYSVIATKEVA